MMRDILKTASISRVTLMRRIELEMFTQQLHHSQFFHVLGRVKGMLMMTGD
jgi:hypothetical protein